MALQRCFIQQLTIKVKESKDTPFNNQPSASGIRGICIIVSVCPVAVGSRVLNVEGNRLRLHVHIYVFVLEEK